MVEGSGLTLLGVDILGDLKRMHGKPLALQGCPYVNSAGRASCKDKDYCSLKALCMHM